MEMLRQVVTLSSAKSSGLIIWLIWDSVRLTDRMKRWAQDPQPLHSIGTLATVVVKYYGYKNNDLVMDKI